MANRGVYHKGCDPGDQAPNAVGKAGDADLVAFDDDVWELYDSGADTVRRTTRPSIPGAIAQLQRLWLIEADKYNVVPMDDRTSERLEPSMAGRPTLIHGAPRHATLLFRHGAPLGEQRCQRQNRSFSITAELDVPDGGANGVIIAQGGRFGGWAVYAKDGRAKFVYNTLGIQEFATVRRRPDPRRSPPSPDGIRLRRRRARQGRRRSRSTTTEILSGTGRVEHTQPMIFSADETTDIGYEFGTTVDTRLQRPHTSRFTGELHWVQLDVGTDDHDHFIDPDERFPRRQWPGNRQASGPYPGSDLVRRSSPTRSVGVKERDA